jgi:hypothetical protein
VTFKGKRVTLALTAFGVYCGKTAVAVEDFFNQVYGSTVGRDQTSICMHMAKGPWQKIEFG